MSRKDGGGGGHFLTVGEWHHGALRTRKERLPSGVPKEEFNQMFLEKNLPWGSVLMFSQCRQQLLVDVRRGAGTCDDPCKVGSILYSTFMQARVKLQCSTEANMHGLSNVPAPRWASPPRAAFDGIDWTLVRTPMEDVFFKNQSAKFFPASGPGKPLKWIFLQSSSSGVHPWAGIPPRRSDQSHAHRGHAQGTKESRQARIYRLRLQDLMTFLDTIRRVGIAKRKTKWQNSVDREPTAKVIPIDFFCSHFHLLFTRGQGFHPYRLKPRSSGLYTRIYRLTLQDFMTFFDINLAKSSGRHHKKKEKESRV